MNEPAVQHEHRTGALESRLGRLLNAGTLVSGILIASGLVVYLARHGGERSAFRDFTGQPDGLTHPLRVARAAIAFDPAAMAQLGVLCLILVPVVRVVFSLIMFALRKDAFYSAVTLIVLALLGVGLWGAVA